MGKVINFKTSNDILMFQFFKRMIHQNEENIFYFDGTQVLENPGVKVNFNNMMHTYEIFQILGNYWGGWNECPEAITMYNVTKRWEEIYGAEIIDIGYDSIGFSLNRELSEIEIDLLIAEINDINAEANYTGGLLELRNCIKEKSEFYIWWD